MTREPLGVQVEGEAQRYEAFYASLEAGYYPDRENIDDYTAELMNLFGVEAAHVKPQYVRALYELYSDEVWCSWRVPDKTGIAGFAAWLIRHFVPNASRPYDEDNER